MDERPTTEYYEEGSPEFLGTKGVRLAEKLSELRRKLYSKAKQEPEYRFYSLYGLLLRQDVIETAWRIARSRNGAAGVDGVSFKMIELSERGTPWIFWDLPFATTGIFGDEDIDI